MNTIIEALRNIVGVPDFYKQLGSGNYSSYTWDYNSMFEYFFGCILLCITVTFIFRFITNLVKH